MTARTQHQGPAKLTQAPQSPALASLVSSQNFVQARNPFTGKLFFNLPLITFLNADGSEQVVNLSYNPAQVGNDQLGLGWEVPTSCVQFDPATNQYTLTVQGASFPMVAPQTGSESPSKNTVFVIPDSTVIVIYDPQNQVFTVESADGRTQSFKPLPGVDHKWWLVADKGQDHTGLTYEYRVIKESAFLCRVAHTHLGQSVTLSYQPDQPFILREVLIKTADLGSARIQFMESNNCLSIKEGSSDDGVIFSVTYHLHTNHIVSVSLPTQQVGFTYTQQNVYQGLNVTTHYQASGTQPNMQYGPGYLIGSFIDPIGRLILERMDPQDFSIKESGKPGYTNHFTPLILANDRINTYTILPQKDWIIVLLTGDKGGQLAVFATENITYSKGFQFPEATWSVPVSGAVWPLETGFVYGSRDGITVFTKQGQDWQTITAFQHTPYPALWTGNKGGFVYDNTGLAWVDDFSAPDHKTGILGAPPGLLADIASWAEELSTNGVLQATVQSDFSRVMISRAGGTMVVSTVKPPQTFTTPFQTLVYIFKLGDGDRWTLVKTIDDPKVLTHQTLAELSQQLFPKDKVRGNYTFRGAVRYLADQNKYVLQYRNMTILPEPYWDVAIEDIDWSTGIFYSMSQTVHVPCVDQFYGSKNSVYEISYGIKKGPSGYVRTYFIERLREQIRNGEFMFKFANKKHPDKFIRVQTDYVQMGSAGWALLAMIYIGNQKIFSQQIILAPGCAYKTLYEFITGLYEGSVPLNVSEGELTSFLATNVDLPEDIASYLNQTAVSGIARMGDDGRITCPGWTLDALDGFMPRKAVGVYLGRDYVYRAEEGKVQLYKLDPTRQPIDAPVATIPVSSTEDIVNYYPTCLAYEVDGEVCLLPFKAGASQDDPPTPEKEITFKKGKIDTEASFPFSPYFTLATATTLKDQSQSLNVVRVPDLIAGAVGKDSVIGSQIVLTDQPPYQHCSTFTYGTGLQFEAGDIIYGATTTHLSDASGSQGKQVLHIDASTISQDVYNADGDLMVSKAQKSGQSGPVIDQKKHQLYGPPSQITSVLFSHANQLAVATVNDVLFEAQQADFMGFEPYETGRIGQTAGDEPRWQVEKGKPKTGWALTGSQFLALEAGGRVTATYEPNGVAQVFGFGAWVRGGKDTDLPSGSLQFDGPHGSLTANTEVAFKRGEWIYIQAQVPVIHLSPVPKSGKLTLTLSSGTAPTDIDSIWMGPIDSLLVGRVYDAKTRLPIAVLTNRGGVSRLLYDADHNLIATVSPQGVLQAIVLGWLPGIQPKIPGSLSPNQIRCQVSLIPSTGFYDLSDPTDLASRWQYSATDWQLEPGRLIHKSTAKNAITLKDDTLASADRLGCHFKVTPQASDSKLVICFGEHSVSLDPDTLLQGQASVSITAVRLGSRVIIWVGGQLVVDAASSNPAKKGLAIQISGRVTVENLLVYDQPSIKLRYQNNAHQVVQVVSLIDDHQAEVTVADYDELDRKTLTSSPMVVGPDADDHLATYRSLDRPQVGQQLGYVSAPLACVNEVQLLGTSYAAHPTRIYRGSFSEVSRQLPAAFVEKLGQVLPEEYKKSSYHCVVVQNPNGIFNTIVQNSDRQPVATFRPERVGGFIQSQFAYAKNGQLKLMRQPRHFTVHAGSGSVARFERKITYTTDNQLATTLDPDAGIDRRIYSTQGSVLRFQVHYSPTGFGYLLIFDYDEAGNLSRILITLNPELKTKSGQPISLNNQGEVDACLQSLSDIANVPKAALALIRKAIPLRQITTANFTLNPAERGQIQSVITHQIPVSLAGAMPIGPVLELFSHELPGRVRQKQVLVEGLSRSVTYAFSPQGQLAGVGYPFPLLANSADVVYVQDANKRLEVVCSPDRSVIYARYTYVGNTQRVQTEELGPAGLVRRYQYNEANQLKGISDEFITESLAFTQHAYADDAYYDQSVSSTQFSSPWTKNVSGQAGIQLLQRRLLTEFPDQQPYVVAFVTALQNEGYLDDHGFLAKSVSLYDVYDLPTGLIDLGRAIPIIQQHPTSAVTGHQYGYDDSGTLTAAKYAIGEAITQPLKFSPLAIHAYLSSHQLPLPTAEALYARLIKDRLVTEAGQWLLNLTESLTKALEDDDSNGAAYLKAHPISVPNLLVAHFCEGNPLSQDIFIGYYLKWTHTKPSDPDGPLRMQEAEQSWAWLQEKGFVGEADGGSIKVTSKMIAESLMKVVGELELTHLLVSVIAMVQFYQTQAIGQSANDVHVYDCDANGNMSQYNVGSTGYLLAYSSASNQIKTVTENGLGNDNRYAISHDRNGNVTSAPHKGIASIAYDPLTNRPSLIVMQDGRRLRFAYDGNGYRVLKRVTDQDGALLLKIRYTRSEGGLVLAEEITTPDRHEKVAYVYGNGGLIGFIKNAQFYTVVKDHEGSVRVVVGPDKQVVFAAQYLPYGQSTQTFGDPTICRYQYIGAEYDAETGLYNMGARLYDPDLGRFYQVDPLQQFASPYIYSGNSPVSFVDPSGLFSWSALGAGLISGLEVAAGLIVDVLSGGTLSDIIGGTLIGAGVAGITDAIETRDDFSWKQWAEQEGIGAAVGALTAGLGAAEASIVEGVSTEFAEDSMEGMAARLATRIVFKAVSGSVSNVGQTILENAVAGRAWDAGVERAALIGALTGGLGEGLDEITGQLTSKIGFLADDAGQSLLVRAVKRAVTGMVIGFSKDATTTLITNAITGRPLDSGLMQAAIGDFVGGLRAGGGTLTENRHTISRGLKEEPIESETNCMAEAVFKGLQNQGIDTDIESAKALRVKAAEHMEAELESNPDQFKAKFSALIKESIAHDTIGDLPPELQATVDEIRAEWVESGEEHLDDIIERHVTEDTMRTYIQSVKDGETWGNFMELDTMGQVLKVKFKVQLRDGKWTMLGLADADHSVYLNFTGNHYNLFNKKGVTFFRTKRLYEPVEHEVGWGAGKGAMNTIKSAKSNTAVEQGISKKYRTNKRVRDALKRVWTKLRTQLIRRPMIKYVTNSGKIIQRAFGAVDFSRGVLSNPRLHDVMDETVLSTLVDQGGSYRELKDKCSFSRLVESNHMPPKSVIERLFGYDEYDISCVSMYESDHRIFPSTGYLGDFSPSMKATIAKAIHEAGFPPPAQPIGQPYEYDEYLESLYDGKTKATKQVSYGKMMEVEIRLKVLLFGDRYQTGIREAISYAKAVGYISASWAKRLDGINDVATPVSRAKPLVEEPLRESDEPLQTDEVQAVPLMPGVGMGPVKLGMTREAIFKALDLPLPPSFDGFQDYIETLGLSINYQDGVAILLQCNGVWPVFLEAFDMFGQSTAVCITRLKELDPDLVVGANITRSEKLGIGLVGDPSSDEPPALVGIFKPIG